MITFDDDEILEDDVKFERISAKQFEERRKDMMYSFANPVWYSSFCKTFLTSETIDNYKLGVILEKNSNFINVLYKGFLLNEPINISSFVPEKYIQSYIIKQFNDYKTLIKQKMPRIKRLKRLNLKLLSKEQTQLIYHNLDLLIGGYEKLFDYDYAQRLKAQIVTTPFYIMDNGIIKIYHFDTNEMTDAEFSGANFLCYFTFQLK